MVIFIYDFFKIITHIIFFLVVHLLLIYITVQKKSFLIPAALSLNVLCHHKNCFLKTSKSFFHFDSISFLSSHTVDSLIICKNKKKYSLNNRYLEEVEEDRDCFVTVSERFFQDISEKTFLKIRTLIYQLNNFFKNYLLLIDHEDRVYVVLKNQPSILVTLNTNLFEKHIDDIKKVLLILKDKKEGESPYFLDCRFIKHNKIIYKKGYIDEKIF